MLNVSRQNNQPLWDVILQSDLLESGLTRPQSLAENAPPVAGDGANQR